MALRLKKLNFKQGSRTELLGIDGESVVYVGEVNGEKSISRIYYGTLDESQSLWRKSDRSHVVL